MRSSHTWAEKRVSTTARRRDPSPRTPPGDRTSKPDFRRATRLRMAWPTKPVRPDSINSLGRQGRGLPPARPRDQASSTTRRRVPPDRWNDGKSECCQSHVARLIYEAAKRTLRSLAPRRRFQLGTFRSFTSDHQFAGRCARATARRAAVYHAFSSDSRPREQRVAS